MCAYKYYNDRWNLHNSHLNNYNGCKIHGYSIGTDWEQQCDYIGRSDYNSRRYHGNGRQTVMESLLTSVTAVKQRLKPSKLLQQSSQQLQWYLKWCQWHLRRVEELMTETTTMKLAHKIAETTVKAFVPNYYGSCWNRNNGRWNDDKSCNVTIMRTIAAETTNTVLKTTTTAIDTTVTLLSNDDNVCNKYTGDETTTKPLQQYYCSDDNRWWWRWQRGTTTTTMMINILWSNAYVVGWSEKMKILIF